MQVSFIIPLFNRLDLTREMLATLPPSLPVGLAYEILFVDDGSTDGTREWLATLPLPVRVILNESNAGYAAANNRGAAFAQGDLLVFLNNDLRFAPGWLEPMLHAHQVLGPKAGIIGNIQRRIANHEVDHVGISFDIQGKPAHDRTPPTPRERCRFVLRLSPAVTGACILLSSGLWRELGGFDESYVNGCEDVDLCLRALRLGRHNGVALKSEILHHVSASPGRKLRDEANTCRLLLRWRPEIVRIAATVWFRRYYERGIRDPLEFRDDWLALSSVAFHLSLYKHPPIEAVAAVQNAIDIEFDRWRELGVLAEVMASEQSRAPQTAAAG